MCISVCARIVPKRLLPEKLETAGFDRIAKALELVLRDSFPQVPGGLFDFLSHSNN